jgi:hypothetical protein
LIAVKLGHELRHENEPPDDEGWGGEILARYERGVMFLLFILAVAFVVLIIWLGAYLIGLR